MNAAVRAVVRMGIYVGCKVYLIKEVRGHGTTRQMFYFLLSFFCTFFISFFTIYILCILEVDVLKDDLYDIEASSIYIKVKELQNCH